MSALFLVFEGIDGSGKSLQSEFLFRHVVSKGFLTVRLSEPTEGEWGRRIREMIRNDTMIPAIEQHRLFLKDRKDDVEKNILPALNEKRIVIMDRYYYSNAAYQGALGLPPDWIIQENRDMNVPEPDRIYLIDIPPDVALRRIAGRNRRKDIFESETFLKRVREIFCSLVNEKFLIIDGCLGVEEIFDVIKADFDMLVS
jgi:dTMP kinase